MNQSTGWMIGLSALAMVVLCGGLSAAGIYVVARRASVTETQAIAEAQEQLRRAEAEQRAAEARAREERMRAEAEIAQAQTEAERARLEAERASDPPSSDDEERAGVARRVVRRAQSQLRGCYEQTLRAAPTATVRAEATLVWSAEGALVSATITELSAEPPAADTPALRRCLEGAFAGSMVPRGTGALTVRIPLVFQPS